jgi:hypothetical protein
LQIGRLGVPDASIVAVCERLDIDTVPERWPPRLANLRPSHRSAVRLVPE